jgi:hypothetical protein
MLTTAVVLTLFAHANDAKIMGGLEKGVIDSYIKRQMPKIRHCYESTFKDAPEHPAGRVMTSFTIGSDGHVSKADIVDTTLKNDAVEGCLANVLTSTIFPEPKGGGTVTVDYPFEFSPDLKHKKKARKNAGE